MNTLQTMQNILKAESEAIINIPLTTAYEKATDLIVEHVHARGGKIVASGVGKAGNIAALLASTFSSTGTPAISINPCDAQHGDLGTLQPNDILILISNSGSTKEIMQLMQCARMLYPGISAIAITGVSESPLAKESDVALITAQADEVGPYGLTPTTSVTMMTVIGHLLVNAVTSRTEFTREHYAMLHRGGNLGQKLREALN